MDGYFGVCWYVNSYLSYIAYCICSMLYNFAILRSKILKFGAAKDLEIRYGKAILNFKYFIRIKG